MKHTERRWLLNDVWEKNLYVLRHLKRVLPSLVSRSKSPSWKHKTQPHLPLMNNMPLIRHETSRSRSDPWSPSNSPEESVDLNALLHIILYRWFMVCALKKCRSVGWYRASGGLYSTGMGVVGMCMELCSVDHELPLSLPQWLTRGPLCDTNFAVVMGDWLSWFNCMIKGKRKCRRERYGKGEKE